jgi:hypothetical protein
LQTRVEVGDAIRLKQRDRIRRRTGHAVHRRVVEEFERRVAARIDGDLAAIRALRRVRLVSLPVAGEPFALELLDSVSGDLMQDQ